MTQRGRNVFLGICSEELELASPLNTWESRPDGSASVTSPRAGRLQRPWGPTWARPWDLLLQGWQGSCFYRINSSTWEAGEAREMEIQGDFAKGHLGFCPVTLKLG